MLEYKRLDFDDCGLKLEKASGKGTFEGYLSVFGRVDSYGDTVIKGAFLETLAGRKRMPPMLLNHNGLSQLPVGVWTAMSEDDHGLHVKGELTDGNSLSEDLYASMRHGAISGLSIGYRVKKSERIESTGGRKLVSIDLREGSVVTMPAEDEARVDSVKSLIETIETLSDCEDILRDAGFSRSTAKHFLSCIKGLVSVDADKLENEIRELRTKLASTEAARNRAQRLEALQRHI